MNVFNMIRVPYFERRPGAGSAPCPVHCRRAWLGPTLPPSHVPWTVPPPAPPRFIGLTEERPSPWVLPILFLAHPLVGLLPKPLPVQGIWHIFFPMSLISPRDARSQVIDNRLPCSILSSFLPVTIFVTSPTALTRPHASPPRSPLYLSHYETVGRESRIARFPGNASLGKGRLNADPPYNIFWILPLRGTHSAPGSHPGPSLSLPRMAGILGGGSPSFIPTEGPMRSASIPGK